MNTTQSTTSRLEETKVNVKIKIAALWTTLMFLYTYADILGFYTPGVIEQLMAGEVEGIQLTEGFLTVMAVWMAIPSVMIFLSLTLKANANRWLNVILGIVSIGVLGATSFVGEFSIRYAFTAMLEGILIASIVWHAWKWPKQEDVGVTA